MWTHENYFLQGTNISPKNCILKMILLFWRWDILVPWRVYISSGGFAQPLRFCFWGVWTKDLTGEHGESHRSRSLRGWGKTGGFRIFVVALGSSLFPRFKARSEISALKKKSPLVGCVLGKESHEILWQKRTCAENWEHDLFLLA